MVLTMVIAGIWGVAEATLFFIVPDVFLTWVALGDRRSALEACVPAIAGALAGGAVMYEWGRRDPTRAVAAVDAVPGITPATIAGVERDLTTRGWFPMFMGSIVGVPYKIYAVKSGALGRSLAAFLFVSIFARAFRFVGLVLATSWISDALPDGPLLYRRLVLLGAWTVVYVVYFRVKGR